MPPVGEISVEAYARLTLGLALGFLGDAEEGERHVRHAKRVAEQVGNAEYIARANAHVAEVLRLRGRLGEALQLMLDGERTAVQLGMRDSFGNSLSVNAAEDQFRLGRWDAAAERLERTARLNLRLASRLLQHSMMGQLEVQRRATRSDTYVDPDADGIPSGNAPARRKGSRFRSACR